MSVTTTILVKAASSKNGRKVLGGCAVIFIISLIFIFAIPVMLLSLPFTSFLNNDETASYREQYQKILLEYNEKIDKTSQEQKDKYKAENIFTEYPKVEIIMAYDNVINRERYLDSKESIKISKKEIFDFLDYCMLYEYIQNGNYINVRLKNTTDISNYFSEQEKKDMFTQIYETLKNQNSAPDINLKDLTYLEGGIKIPYLSQLDQRWSGSPYGSSTVGKSGCGTTSMAMIVNGLTNSTVTPAEVAKWSYNHNYYVPGAGTSWAFFEGYAKEHNLKVKNLSRNNPQAILNELSSGNPVIVSMSPGHFTTGGHFIVLRGVTASGKILVNDPASFERSQKEWSFSLILCESSTLSPSCFWAISKS